MSVVIRLKVPIEMHYTVIPMGTSKVNSSRFISFKSSNIRSKDNCCRYRVSVLRATDGSALSVDSAALSVDRAAIDRLRCVVGRSWLVHQRLSSNQYQHSRRVFRTLLEIAQDNNPTMSRRCAICKRALDSTFTAADRMSKLYNQKNLLLVTESELGFQN